MTDLERLQALERRAKEIMPSFEIRFKDESNFMKMLGKILFFNKGFMTNYITTIGTKVYFQNRNFYYNNPKNSFRVLSHECVHAYDYTLNPIKFVLRYLFPQILALFSLFVFFAFISPYFWGFLLFLVCLAPLPSSGRKNIEVRGYGMSIKVEQWRNELYPGRIEQMSENFTGPNYYYMYPYKDEIIEELTSWTLTDDCLTDKNIMYMEIKNLL